MTTSRVVRIGLALTACGMLSMLAVLVVTASGTMSMLASAAAADEGKVFPLGDRYHVDKGGEVPAAPAVDPVRPQSGPYRRAKPAVIPPADKPDSLQGLFPPWSKPPSDSLGPPRYPAAAAEQTATGSYSPHSLPVSEPAPAECPRVDFKVTLRDASTLDGSLPESDTLDLTAVFGKVSIPVKLIARIEWGQPPSTTKFHLRNGDRLTGGVAEGNLMLKTSWGKALIEKTHIATLDAANLSGDPPTAEGPTAVPAGHIEQAPILDLPTDTLELLPLEPDPEKPEAADAAPEALPEPEDS